MSMLSPTQEDESATRGDYALRRLKSDLKANRFKPGQRLRFDDMRSIYDVGIGPLREALSRLTEAGLVVQIGQKGFRVAPVSLEDLADVIETRRFLEVRALQDAIENGNDEWEGNLVAAFHRFSKLATNGAGRDIDRAEWEKHHTVLHRALICGCQSRWLMHFWSTVFDQAERYRRMAFNAGFDFGYEVDEHRTIVDAVIRRDAEAACEMLHRHIGRSADKLKTGVIETLKQQLPSVPQMTGED
jgi:GntR family carbon starvation induced transcriptional regulator